MILGAKKRPREDITQGLDALKIRKIEISFVEGEKIVNIFITDSMPGRWIHTIVPEHKSLHDVLDRIAARRPIWNEGKYIIEEEI